MNEFVCRVSAEMREDGSIAVRIAGSSANMVRCLSGLMQAVSDLLDVSAVQVAFDALRCSAETEMVGKSAVPPEVCEAARKRKERKDEGTD